MLSSYFSMTRCDFKAFKCICLGGYDFSAEGKPTLLDMNDDPVRDQRLRFSQSDAEQICEIY